ncbi:hypothetical protein O206_22275 [Ochrobactrum sp. EGD-AQ16]|nr:hypothetical protein O206_22275 [Ochrobactrum sp. EGD-AQ16]
MLSLSGEAFTIGALPFGFDEITGSLPRKQTDKIEKAGIRLRRIIGRCAFRWQQNHPHIACRCPFPFCHDVILVPGRTIPLKTKTGLETGRCECEIAGI